MSHIRSYSESIGSSSASLRNQQLSMESNNQQLNQLQISHQRQQPNINERPSHHASSSSIADAPDRAGKAEIVYHGDSQKSLDQLFDLDLPTKTVPLRNRNLPNSFFNPSNSQASSPTTPTFAARNNHARSTSFHVPPVSNPPNFNAHIRTRSTIGPLSNFIAPEPTILEVNDTNSVQPDSSDNAQFSNDHNMMPQVDVKVESTMPVSSSTENVTSASDFAEPTSCVQQIDNSYQNEVMPMPRNSVNHFKNYSTPNFTFEETNTSNAQMQNNLRIHNSIQPQVIGRNPTNIMFEQQSPHGSLASSSSSSLTAHSRSSSFNQGPAPVQHFSCEQHNVMPSNQFRQSNNIIPHNNRNGHCVTHQFINNQTERQHMHMKSNMNRSNVIIHHNNNEFVQQNQCNHNRVRNHMHHEHVHGFNHHDHRQEHFVNNNNLVHHPHQHIQGPTNNHFRNFNPSYTYNHNGNHHHQQQQVFNHDPNFDMMHVSNSDSYASFY